MAEAGNITHRVLQLKEHLNMARDPKKILKALKRLEVLEMSLDVLVETGIGKTVNGFRKHDTAGSVAKSLVKRWKKLLPSENGSECKGRKRDSGRGKKKLSVSKENKQSREESESAPREKKRSSKAPKKRPAGTRSKPKRKEVVKPYCGLKVKDARSVRKPKDSPGRGDGTRERAPDRLCTHTASHRDSPCKSGQRSPLAPGMLVSELTEKHAENGVEFPEGEQFEPPTMSFESYLNYDQVPRKRKRRPSCKRGQPPPAQDTEESRPDSKRALTPTAVRDPGIPSQKQTDQLEKKAKTTSLEELLNLPLPKFLPEISLVPSPPYVMEFKAPAANIPCNEPNPFTCRRLNSKMQVYSGSKTTHLPKMLSLYVQCIRVLQNNLDSLREVGGVPFELLEPVLERCTPKQLLHIEDCNPTFMEEDDHLWMKHCQREFKNESLLEYESWREMYLRLFDQREQKLKILTKNIISAQSEKPRGRQVKMAYIHSTAKPPRDIRRQQELHGTAGLHSNKYNFLSLQKTDSREQREKTLSSSKQQCSSHELESSF
ncbi:elongin-A-like isoform X2 [Ornithorhynchus anatinus]|uniref:elongin-A-like isoform X2 n=1 Tax=Ornithorhynchus anatinus TaxID=9258 RepID=UPI0010A80BBD|nr:elongin-A-like isoform X2 [Ornithorhynchus anatinus]